MVHRGHPGRAGKAIITRRGPGVEREGGHCDLVGRHHRVCGVLSDMYYHCGVQLCAEEERGASTGNEQEVENRIRFRGR